jgi:hypothetical protein
MELTSTEHLKHALICKIAEMVYRNSRGAEKGRLAKLSFFGVASLVADTYGFMTEMELLDTINRVNIRKMAAA